MLWGTRPMPSFKRPNKNRRIAIKSVSLRFGGFANSCKTIAKAEPHGFCNHADFQAALCRLPWPRATEHAFAKEVVKNKVDKFGAGFFSADKAQNVAVLVVRRGFATQSGG
ncbi:MAG: hypothetical protein LBS91_01880, partial [Clostridiales Family XIII bacterium]|nr:hypothetical protein [Clostridiales Family XIII bacterium]